MSFRTSAVLARPAAVGLAATALWLAASTSALALEGKALLDSLIAKADGRVAYASAEENGSTLTVRDLTFTPKEGEGQDMTIATATFENLRDDGTKVLLDAVDFATIQAGEDETVKSATIEKVEGRAISVPMALFDGGLAKDPYGHRIVLGSWDATNLTSNNKDGSTVTLAGVDIDDLDTPVDFRYAPEQIEAAGDREPAAPLTLGKFAISDLRVNSGSGYRTAITGVDLTDLQVPSYLGAPVTQWLSENLAFTIGEIRVTNDAGTSLGGLDGLSTTVAKADGQPWTQTTTMTGAFLAVEAIDDANAQATLKTLGYDAIRVDSNGVATYDMETGRTTQSPLVIDAKDMFDLKLDYAFTGYTPEVATQISAAFTKPGGQPDMAVLLPLLEAVKLESTSITLTDDSLTGKLLDFQARQMGTTGDQLAQGAPMMIGIGLGSQLGMPEFSQTVANAVGDFLQNKGTLSITTNFPEPISLMQIMAAAQAGPRGVIELLGVQVAAGPKN